MMWHVTTGSLQCPDCGKDPVSSHSAYRLRLDESRQDIKVFACDRGHQWTVDERVEQVPASRAVRRLSLRRPALSATVRGLILAVVVGALVVASRAVLGWNWRLVFVLASGAAALMVLLLRLPRRASLRRAYRELERLVGAGRVVVFEVVGWKGSRRIAAWAASRRHRSLTLQFGDPATSGPWVSVTTRRAVGLPDRARERIAHRLRRAAEPSPPPELPTTTLHRHLINQDHRLDRLPPPEWSGATFTVEGHPHPVQLASVGDSWAAVTTVEDVTLEMVASGVEADSVELRRLSTLAGYPPASLHMA